jgi:hypothetical protein
MSMGIAVLSIAIGLGIMFLLWILYHFILQSSNSKFYGKIHAQVNRSMGSLSPEGRRLLTLSAVRRALLLLFTSQKPRHRLIDVMRQKALRQQMFSLRRRIDAIQEEREQRRSTGKPLPLTRTASRN